MLDTANQSSRRSQTYQYKRRFKPLSNLRSRYRKLPSVQTGNSKVNSGYDASGVILEFHGWSVGREGGFSGAALAGERRHFHEHATVYHARRT